jgi:uncharacterized membrane protein
VREWVAYNKIALDVTHDPKMTEIRDLDDHDRAGERGGTRVRWTLDYRMNGGYLGHFSDKFLLGSVHGGRISEGLSNLKRYTETGETPPTL